VQCTLNAHTQYAIHYKFMHYVMYPKQSNRKGPGTGLRSLLRDLDLGLGLPSSQGHISMHNRTTSIL